MICPNCQTLNPDFARFCKLCGKNLALPAGGETLPKKKTGHFQEISNVRGVLFAILLTAAFLLLLQVAMPEGRTHDIFLARGWVPYSSTFLFMWAIILLFDRRRNYDKEYKKLKFWEHTFPLKVEHADIDALLSKSQTDHVIDDRVRISLQRFGAGNTRQEVLESLRDESAIDSNLLSSSYMMLKTIIWAIPVTGFIGTMVGMAQAIGFFSNLLNTVGLEQMEDFKKGLESPLSALSLAFDTTLLALILTGIIMFFMTAMHKAEENLLTRIDTFCSRKIAGHLDFPRKKVRAAKPRP
jgi:biopolymer transport protein ExbB/TolQ